MAKRKPKTGSYEVGYGKPPAHSRFKPGVSGNPSGKKNGRSSLKTDYEAELGDVVTATENGKSIKLSKQQLILKAMVAKAAKGNTAAIGQAIELIKDMFGLGVETEGDRDHVSADDHEVIQGYLQRLAKRKAGGDD